MGAAPLNNRPAGTWAEFYATRRVLPYVRELRDSGRLSPAEVGLFERLAAGLPELAGPAEPPARIHGDLWCGNVVWSGGRGWLVDPAAHGGHRETDLAMLTLFGESWVPRLLTAYEEVAAPADGWRERQRLHQVTRCSCTPFCSAPATGPGRSRRPPRTSGDTRLGQLVPVLTAAAGNTRAP